MGDGGGSVCFFLGKTLERLEREPVSPPPPCRFWLWLLAEDIRIGLGWMEGDTRWEGGQGGRGGAGAGYSKKFSMEKNCFDSDDANHQRSLHLLDLLAVLATRTFQKFQQRSRAFPRLGGGWSTLTCFHPFFIFFLSIFLSSFSFLFSFLFLFSVAFFPPCLCFSAFGGGVGRG